MVVGMGDEAECSEVEEGGAWRLGEEDWGAVEDGALVAVLVEEKEDVGGCGVVLNTEAAELEGVDEVVVWTVVVVKVEYEVLVVKSAVVVVPNDKKVEPKVVVPTKADEVLVKSDMLEVGENEVVDWGVVENSRLEVDEVLVAAAVVVDDEV
eukprot:764464-Rhodomonas_salina.1